MDLELKNVDMAGRRYRSHHPHLPASVRARAVSGCWSDWIGELDSVYNHMENLQLPIQGVFFKLLV
jgi:hypothetical protein